MVRAAFNPQNLKTNSYIVAIQDFSFQYKAIELSTPEITSSIYENRYNSKIEKRPGSEISLTDITFEFLVDSDMKNYLEIKKWMYLNSFESSQYFKDIYINYINDIDGSIIFNEKYLECFPSSLSKTSLDNKEGSIMKGTVTFTVNLIEWSDEDGKYNL